MSKQRDSGNSTVPRISEREARYQKWVSRAYGFAGFCLAALAIIEITDTASPLTRTLLMLGIGAAGTVAWVMQAKRMCPHCGELYGYHFRIVHANICRKCGGEFPRWLPGHGDDTSQKE